MTQPAGPHQGAETLPRDDHAPTTAPPPILKTGAGGLMMGLANLIPGVSGGTMILAMGLYTEFIDSVADMTAFRFSRRRLAFLTILGGGAVASIAGLAPVILYSLFHFDTVMYALFIGLTLGGAPALLRSLRLANAGVGCPIPSASGGLTQTLGSPAHQSAPAPERGQGTLPGWGIPAAATASGVGLMILIVLAKEQVALPRHTLMDLVSGVVAAVTMVLPGISGSYVLLIMGQYDRVVGSVKDLDFSIIVPVGVGVVVGVASLSNALKYLLHRWVRPTIGFLLGLLLGSVIGLWPFGIKPTIDAMTARNTAELARFAERKGLYVDDTMPHDALVTYIAAHWPDRSKVNDYAPFAVGSALMMMVAGFGVTSTLSKGCHSLTGNP